MSEIALKWPKNGFFELRSDKGTEKAIKNHKTPQIHKFFKEILFFKKKFIFLQKQVDFFQKATIYLRTIEKWLLSTIGHRRKYTKMYPFFQGEVESTEKKWVFLLTIILKTVY